MIGMHRSVVRGRAVVATAVAGLLLASVVGGATAADPAASQEPVELTFWTWVGGIEDVVAQYEAENPGITINVENVGCCDQQYTKLQTVIEAGSGAPDLAQFDYPVVASFALTGGLADITDLVSPDLQDKFVPSAWDSVTANGRLYGVPQDVAPTVMYYRQDVFDRLGVAVPTTWDEFQAAAAAIRAADPEVYITFADPGNQEPATAAMWAQQTWPWRITASDALSVDLQNEGARNWADLWTGMLQNDQVEVASQGSDEWFKAMTDGRYAAWIIGAWGIYALEGQIPSGSGLWRVAPMPQWTAGANASAASGGGATAVLAQSEHQAEAAKFAEWLNGSEAGATGLNGLGLMPAARSVIEAPAYVDATSEYLGGQKANALFSEAAAAMPAGWEWLPYQQYANSVYKDTVGQAINNKTDLNVGLQQWQDRIVTYGQEQGYTVTTP
jgi:multiple sugar transport system substrate-binding protein